MSARIKELRDAIKAKRVDAAARSDPVRRVYVLSTTMVESILQYQLEHQLRSEAEAVRQLLDISLTAWEKARG